jgi:hypothetical protein
MEHLFEKASKALADYNPKSQESYLKTLKTLSAAVASCRAYIKENAQTDRGCAQRIARNLDQLLEALPGNKCSAEDISALHTRRLAEAHVDLIQKDIAARIKELEEGKVQAIQDWVRQHPVFGELKRVAQGALPDGAYALLFEKSADGELKLVTQKSHDGRIFTRFRPAEFKVDQRLYKGFKGRAPVVGAAIIAEKELLLLIGSVPEPQGESTDRLRHLLAVSNQAASLPVRDFLEQYPALKELNELASRHKVPKQAYILLFQSGEGETPVLMTKTSADGRTITRFWSNEFSDKYKLFESFRHKPAIVGAAVVQDNKLLHSFGQLPEPQEGQSQVEVLLSESRKVLDQPLLDFVSGNEVLAGLNQFAAGENARADAYVVLFELLAGGTLAVLPIKSKGSQRQVRIPVGEFSTARAIHDKLAKGPPVIGASVIRAEAAPVRKGQASQSDERKRMGSAPAAKPVVLAAFGRTPLKSGHLATPETLRRLGIDIGDPTEAFSVRTEQRVKRHKR